ncbi:MAG: diacylglycerol/lipid kinase family protein [Frankiaceae bacterium]
MKLFLIANPSAGGGRTARVRPQVEAALRRLDPTLESVVTASMGHADTLTERGLACGRVVCALGGDGLIGRVAGGVAAGGGVLVPLPGGRGNDFCRGIGLPDDPVAVAGELPSLVERPLDIAAANGRPYLGIASLGIDSVVQSIANQTKIVRGGAVYTYAALKGMVIWKHSNFSVDVDGDRRDLHGWSVVVANNQFYGGGMRFAPSADMEDGRLDVMLVSRCSKLTFLMLFPKVFKGEHASAPMITTMRGSKVRVDADRRFKVYADGEELTSLPCEVTITPGGLRVLTPQGGGPALKPLTEHQRR